MDLLRDLLKVDVPLLHPHCDVTDREDSQLLAILCTRSGFKALLYVKSKEATSAIWLLK
jgi:hypothetical protein